MTNVQRVQSSAWRTVVLNSVCHVVLYFRMNTHQERKTNAKEHGLGVILSFVYTGLQSRRGLLSNRTVPKLMHYAEETKFYEHKSVTCPECAQLSLVYCSVHETCADGFILHCSVTFCSPYVLGKTKTYNTLSRTLSVYFSDLFAQLVEPKIASP